jgi:hypothetical protein
LVEDAEELVRCVGDFEETNFDIPCSVASSGAKKFFFE